MAKHDPNLDIRLLYIDFGIVTFWLEFGPLIRPNCAVGSVDSIL